MPTGNPILETNQAISQELADAIANVSGGSKQAQFITDTKFSTKTLAAAVWPAVTDFFTTAPVVDPTLDNYDAGNQLVSSGKIFMIKGVAVCLRGGAIVDLNTVIETGVLVMTIQNKEDGRYRVRNLRAAGGLNVTSAQIAAAAVFGATNGAPTGDVWDICDLLAHTNQSVKCSLLGPITTPYTITVATSVEVDLHGYEIRPLA